MIEKKEKRRHQAVDPGYVELHAASAFSFLRGASVPEQLADEASFLGIPAMAVLDRDGVYGAPRFYASANDQPQKVRPRVGAEITLADGSVLPLLVQNRTGYQNLCQLISHAKLLPRPSDLSPEGLAPEEDILARKRRCFATWKEVEAHAEGLIALTGDEDGPLRRAWHRGGRNAVKEALKPLQRIFGPERLHVEIQRHRVRGEEAIIEMLAAVAASAGLPLLATGGVLQATKERRLVADIFTCLRNHTTLDAAGHLLAPNENRHVHDASHMRALFCDYPEAVAQSVRLESQLEFTLHDLGYKFPDFPTPEEKPMEAYLAERVLEGARERYRTTSLPAKVRNQIDKELALIKELGFSGYFLIVWDICRWCREEQKIMIQGRGSAANSIVCYALGITAVDPIANNLLFERFLSRGRLGIDGHPSWPDVDLDLPSGDRREKAIQEIYRRYSDRGAAMVANVITYRGRSTTREVGKVLGLGEDILDRFSAFYANGDFEHTMGLKEQFHQSGLPQEHPRLQAVLLACEMLKGLPRHLGQHSGGMVLCPGRLDRIVPIEPATMIERTVVQWDKDDCEDLGLVKIDFLGLGMMAVLQDCREICAARGQPWELYKVPLDDTPTYDLMCDADTIGVFQIESRAQMATLPKIQPRKFYDVVVEVAIVRPGPIVGKVTSPMLQRRAGKEKIVCLDPEVHEQLRDVLERTYGIVLFQEQMLSIAMKLGGFDATQAEELRRALGFRRNNERLEKATQQLRAALGRHGHSERVIEKVVDATQSFALYGFPESHAFSFGLLAYVSTWLKVHHIAVFYAALLNNQPMGFYSPATLVQDGRRHGLRVRPVDVIHSDWNCTVETDKVMRVGLRYVQGLREESARRLTVARHERPFESLADFLQRVPLAAHERRALAAVGALAGLSAHRRAALWQVEAAWSAEESLFQSSGLVEEDVPPLPPMNAAERVQADFEGTSLTTGSHPMRLVRERIPDIWRASDLILGRDGERVTIGGSVICRQRPGTAKGVVFVSLEDETGIANAIVRATLFEEYRLIINEEPHLRITGRLQHRDGVIHVQAEHIDRLRLDEVPAQASHDFH